MPKVEGTHLARNFVLCHPMIEGRTEELEEAKLAFITSRLSITNAFAQYRHESIMMADFW